MASKDSTAEAKTARTLYREELLRGYQDSLVGICLKKAALVSAAAARAAIVSTDVSREWVEWALCVDSESSAEELTSGAHSHSR